MAVEVMDNPCLDPAPIAPESSALGAHFDALVHVLAEPWFHSQYAAAAIGTALTAFC